MVADLNAATTSNNMLVAALGFIIVCLIVAIGVILRSKQNKMASDDGYLPVTTSEDEERNTDSDVLKNYDRF